MRENNYFSWKNISEITDIDSHIAFASALLGKYEWEQDTKQSLERQLAAIVEKQNDKMLNISVIGEFSTGKSSFINALVGYELLAVNVIQGTTVAITIIEYSTDFSIALTYCDGKTEKKTYGSIDSLRQQLYAYTTDETYAKKISYVTVTLPSEILGKGYRIIDTPGTNSLDLWHEDITRRAIRELSDLSIVLTDANRAMPTTLVAFLDGTLGDAVRNSTFVANKIDQVKEKERDGIIKFIGNKVRQSFEIEDPMVLPFSAVALTNTFATETHSVDDNSLMLTTSSLGHLLSYTVRQRMQAQAMKILRLIDDIYSTLDNNIKRIADQYQQELQLLERSKQIDLKPFIAKHLTARQNSFMAEAREYRNTVESVCDSLVSNAKKNVEDKIDNCEAINVLTAYVKRQLHDNIIKEGQSIASGTEIEFYELRKLFHKELKRFQADFEKEFDKLKILSVQFNIRPTDVAVRHSANSANIAPVAKLISEEMSKENWAIGTGISAGAIIGSFILPVVGTVIGGIIGGSIGNSAAPKIDDVKRKVKSKLAVPLNAYYKSVANDCMTNYNNYVDDITAHLTSEINRYYSTYASNVNEKINDWQEQRSAINQKVQKIEQEINGIKHRQQAIKNIISNL